MRQRYMNAMTLVQRYEMPDIFLTITCNKNWAKIKNELLSTNDIENRLDLISWSFSVKLEEFKDELFKKNIFEKVVAYT